jgi:FkbM family methyltransferase
MPINKVIMTVLKKIVFSLFPNVLLKHIKKYHYYYKIKHAKPSDEEDLLMVKQCIKPTSDVIDIGANVGLYTKFLSESVGPEGKVLSFEPIPETYNYLKNNIQKLNLHNVVALQVAISDHKGKAIMQVPRFNDNRLNFYEAAITDKPNDAIIHFEVETNTLDNFCIQYNLKPLLIKCDVEGHEWLVFKGSNDTITRYKPILLVEINQDLSNPDPNTARLLDYLDNKGYQTYITANNRLKKRESEKKVNYYFITEEHRRLLNDIIEKEQ